MGFLFVGLGGALGAMLRYALSLICVKTDFPLMTFLTNILGAFAIGLIAGIASAKKAGMPNLILFLKTGFCGGFTTFSTFSLETLTLFENGSLATGSLYAVLSFICCIIGVWLGKITASMATGTC